MEQTENKALDIYDELKAAARPLQEYLRKNYHMLCTAVVNLTRIDVMESRIFTPTTDWLE